ncbi:MAG: SRPBCC family protein [Actinomycetota bacterium]
MALLTVQRADNPKPRTEVMTKLRPRARLLGLAAACAVFPVYAYWRPRMMSLGATDAETTCTFPGDELVPDPSEGATMATTLPAPPEKVWPWLVQMGGGRGGWYSWDWVDNGGVPSADRIEPDWQDLEVGQHLSRPPKGPTNWWTVVIVEPNRSLVLQTSYDMFGQSFDPRTGAVPWASTNGTWGFYLQKAPEGRTRLVVRTRSFSRPSLLTRPLSWLVGEPVHLIMQTRQFHNLSARVAPAAVQAGGAS